MSEPLYEPVKGTIEDPWDYCTGHWSGTLCGPTVFLRDVRWLNIDKLVGVDKYRITLHLSGCAPVVLTGTEEEARLVEQRWLAARRARVPYPVHRLLPEELP